MCILNEDGTCPSCGRDYSNDIPIGRRCRDDSCPGNARRFYKFNYEHVSNKAINEIEAVLKEDVARMQYADSGFMVLLVFNNKKDHKVALFVRNEIWKRNNGLLCEFLEVTEDDVGDYL